ncbi:MAG TPA: carbohydrate ABC transporter permease [Gaiellaceae bacterium]|jgi:ABC-type glycerol-3-phosphate transport system permease component
MTVTGRSPVRWVRASRRRGDLVSQLALVGLLSLGALVMLIPFVWMIATSLSREADIAMPRIPRLWPPDPSFFNYRIALQNLPLLHYYLNSIIVVGASTVGYLLFSSLTGYAFAKGRFRGKTFFFIAFLTTLLIPFETRMVPLYLLMKDLHLNDSLPALVLPFLVGGFGTFLMRQYISTIPDDYIDAARTDGAGEFLIFWRIILPLCTPALSALAILNILWRWNDVLWPLLVISDPHKYTVTLGLAFEGKSQGTYTGVALATATIAIMPVLFAFVMLQRRIISGITMGGIKG